MWTDIPKQSHLLSREVLLTQIYNLWPKRACGSLVLILCWHFYRAQLVDTVLYKKPVLQIIWKSCDGPLELCFLQPVHNNGLTKVMYVLFCLWDGLLKDPLLLIGKSSPWSFFSHYHMVPLPWVCHHITENKNILTMPFIPYCLSRMHDVVCVCVCVCVCERDQERERKEGRKKMYLMMHLTHFIYCYMASDIL